jgi:hypothetical protein
VHSGRATQTETGCWRARRCGPRPNTAARPSAARLGPPRRCGAPRILSPAACDRFLEDDQVLCRQHEGTDSARRCEALAGAPRKETPRERCYGWPLVGLPFCRAHDPQSREERKAEQEALTTQLARVRRLVREAGPDVQGRVLELLVLRRRVTVADVVGALIEYRVGR